MEGPVEHRTRKRRALLLWERVQVIEMYSTRPRPNYETLAKMFNCGRSQIKNILRQKGQILQEYEKNPDSDRVRRSVPPILLALNQMLDEWIRRALRHNVTLNDDVITQKAVQVQQFLDYDEFDPTKMWLRSFKRRHGYYMVDLNGLEMPKDKPKSLKLRDIFEDLKDSIDPSLVSCVEMRHNRGKPYIASEQDDDDDLKDLDSWDISSDENPSAEGNDTVVLKDNSQALEYLKPLEEFAMLTDNFRAIGLISQLESIFRARSRVSGGMDLCEAEPH